MPGKAAIIRGTITSEVLLLMKVFLIGNNKVKELKVLMSYKTKR